MAVRKRQCKTAQGTKTAWSYVFDAPGSTRQDRRQVFESGFASKKEAQEAEAERRIKEQRYSSHSNCRVRCRCWRNCSCIAAKSGGVRAGFLSTRLVSARGNNAASTRSSSQPSGSGQFRPAASARFSYL
ncbi:MAG: Arm DNA-binding domain-containing protein [Bryobacterales bacterium]|nr:Arm DNA-binding domain-containing protein [Bryobacterales bacterium]